MYDWYALYALWFVSGVGKEELGYTNSKGGGDSAPSLVVPTIMPHNREQVIRNAFEECTRQLAIRLINNIRFAIADELEDACDETLIPPEAIYVAAAEYGGAFDKMIDQETGEIKLPNIDEFWQLFSYSDCETLFDAGFWTVHADAYGGPKWVEITTKCKELHNEVKHYGGDIKKLVGIIDSIYDLEHNTGTLADKLAPNARVEQEDLDNRAKLRSPQDFLPYVSPYVKGLITSAMGAPTPEAPGYV